KFISRLGAELAEDRPVAPPVYGGAVQTKAAAALVPAARAGVVGGVAGGIGGGIGGGFFRGQQGQAAAEASLGSVQTSSIAQTATGQEIADLFQYDIATP